MLYQREYEVTVGSGSLLVPTPDAVFEQPTSPHPVGVHSGFTGAHLLHLAVAGCVHNTVYQEATDMEMPLAGVRVSAFGGFNLQTWSAHIVEYEVDLDTDAETDLQELLLRRVDQKSVIARTVRQGAPVERWR